MLGTEITLLERLRLAAERDLGFDIAFESLDFLSATAKNVGSTSWLGGAWRGQF